MLAGLFENWIVNLHVGLKLAIYVVGLAVGIFCLVKFCDIFVDGASVIAKKLKIPPLIIGLTVVAMGTSLPELAVSISDSIDVLIGGSNANVAIGNVVGSNICNILLVLGLSVIFTPIALKRSVYKRELPILLGVTAIVALLICLFGINSAASLNDLAVTRWEGIILVVIMVGYITYIVWMAKKHPDQLDEVEAVTIDMPLWKAILLVVLGGVGIFLGGQLVEFGAKGLALQGAEALKIDHDMAEALVGLTIVAVGTSLPELVTSCIAAKKGENEIAVGNVIGSNMFNMLFVMGIASIVAPLTIGSQVIVDVAVMLVSTTLLLVFAQKGKLTRAHGIVFVCLYGVYLTYLVLRTVLGWTF